jgi:hypothetical protein
VAMPNLTAADRVALFFARVESDSTLNPNLKRIVPPLRRLAVTDPPLAIARLKAAADHYLPGLPRSEPTSALVRSVDYSRFWEFHLDPAIKARLRTPEDFRRYMDSLADPDAALMAHLSMNPTIVPSAHSWLSRHVDIAGRTADEVVTILAVKQSPPLVIFHFTVGDLLRSRVTIRKPCSLDAVLGDHELWSAAGLASGAEEYLDGDIPRSAVTGLEWRT